VLDDELRVAAAAQREVAVEHVAAQGARNEGLGLPGVGRAEQV
jgi:hypothetical protein